jgi:hypothetical protein
VTKAKISEYDPSASNNTDVNGVNIAEGCAPSGINDAIREVMAALKRFETGSDGDSITVGGNLVVSGSTTISGSTTVSNTFTASLVNVDNLRLDGNTISSTDTSGNVVIAPNSLGQIIVNAGAVGTPIIAPTGDTNTGIFFPAADTIAFAEGGAEAMRIDSSGNVGIGTSSPGNKFSVLTPAGGNTSGFSVGSTNGLLNIWGGVSSGVVFDVTNGTLNGETGSQLLIRQGGVTRLEIAANGTQRSVIPGGTTLYPDFKCRAWVNFNGTSTVAIRASGNVSSITDGGTGTYTVNFSTAMPDDDYSAIVSAGNANTSDRIASTGQTTFSTTACGIRTSTDAGVASDAAIVSFAAFR